MNKRIGIALLASALGLSLQAQNIDFDFPGRNTSEVTEPNYIPWPVARVASESKTLDNGMTLTVAGGDAASAVGSNWNKQTVQSGLKLVGDGIMACNLENGNIVKLTEGSTSIILTIEGMTPGQHSVIAYHNNTDKGQVLPPIEVEVDGVVKQTGVKYSTNADGLKMSDVGRSYVEFNAVEGKPVVIKYRTVPEAGVTYSTTSIFVNGLEFDVNPYGIMDEVPENHDLHADCENEVGLKTVYMSWKGADIAVSHKLVLGTDSTEVANATTYQYEGTAAEYKAMRLSPLQRYWWRVDEVEASGTVHKGKVMTFQPRRLAFPGAEGYGRFAIGGRGGVVYHVTSLEDDNKPGTFRYGISQLSGPRTIVFDVAGVISLKTRLTCSDKFVTIAGQTAPGNGIMLRTSAFGMQSDGITRFIRMRLGHKKLIDGLIPDESHNGKSYSDEEKGTTEETTLGGLDGLGMAGNDHAIMDHCSVSWTIDEAFSSRNAKNMTLQRTLISETLNQAGHPNYGSGTQHGYAATIGGGEMGSQAASYHHNLLAHNEGRNWSISGGLDGGGYYDGHHDIFNNVVYNWGGRASDGGTHELNFVNNYYKKGPATTQTYLLRHQFEGTGKGTQAAYVSGNIREETTGSKTQDKLGTTYRYDLSNGQELTWEPWAAEPFFPSYATIESAEAAYKNVLSDVGCNMPTLDLHDQRMINETLNRTTTTKGSRSGKKGLIDSEEDSGCEGFDLDKLGIVTTQREADWDTDQDGIPDWFEQLTGTNPGTPNNNECHDTYNFYTDLEVYLNWISVPNFILNPLEEKVIDLKPYFAGYKNFEVVDDGMRFKNGFVYDFEGTNLKVQDLFGNRLNSIVAIVKDPTTGISFTRRFNFATIGEADGIEEIQTAEQQVQQPVYDLNGRRLPNARKGLNIQKGKKFVK